MEVMNTVNGLNVSELYTLKWLKQFIFYVDFTSIGKKAV